MEQSKILTSNRERQMSVNIIKGEVLFGCSDKRDGRLTGKLWEASAALSFRGGNLI